MKLARVVVVVALIGACADGGVFPEGSSRTVVEPDLGSSPVVPTSVADVAVTGTLVRPVASSSTGVPEETVVPTTVESGAPTVSSTTEVPSTTLFVLEDPPPTPIDIETDEQLRVVLTGDSITDQVVPYLQWILSQAATIEHRHV